MKLEYKFFNDEWKWFPHEKLFWNKKERYVGTIYGLLAHGCFGIDYGYNHNRGNASYCYHCKKKVPIFIRLFIAGKVIK